MPCFHPWEPSSQLGLPPHIKLPCRQCVGCRLAYSAGWATRCLHETKSHRQNCWLTLTYDDAQLPSRYYTGLVHPKTKKKIYSGTLLKEHPQKFFRRIRKHLNRVSANDNRIAFDYHSVPTEPGRVSETINPFRRSGSENPNLLINSLRPNLRYYYSGEYGEKYNRPHYHICLFGIDFMDKKHTDTTDTGYKLYESQILEKLWPFGRHSIGELNWETAAYTARYIMKKINGKKQKKHYEKIDYETGEIITIAPEFNDMSRDPGIGNDFYENFKTDIYKAEHSQVNVRGHHTQPPRYYDKLHKEFDEAHLKKIKQKRFEQALQRKEHHTPERLLASEIITLRRTQSLTQKL